MSNPCVGCHNYFRYKVGDEVKQCNDLCDKFKLWEEGNCLKSEIDSNSMDSLHMNFYDKYNSENGKVTHEETLLIKKVFDFIKNVTGGIE